MDTSMTKTVIKSAVAVACTAALCITYAASNGKKADTKSADGTAVIETVDPETSYFTEDKAAAYIGISEEALKTIREKIPVYFKGAYETYTYFDENGEEVTYVIYSKAGLDKAVEKLMNDHNYINLRYIQNTGKEDTEDKEVKTTKEIKTTAAKAANEAAATKAAEGAATTAKAAK